MIKILSSSHWKLLAAFVGMTVAVAGFTIYLKSGPAPFVSPPKTVRPWAEKNFLTLSHSVASPGSPMDSRYLARAALVPPPGTSSPLHDYKTIVKIVPPAAAFVPAFELIPFNAQEGFTAGTKSGSIRYVATKAYDSKPDGQQNFVPTPVTFHHPDGKKMTDEELTTAAFPKKETSAWGWQMNGELGTAMRCRIDLKGFENVQGKVQDIFDADTGVSIRQSASLSPSEGGFVLEAYLSLLHDAPVLAVIDLANGPIQEFTLPPEKTASVSQPDFSLEVMEVMPGQVSATCIVQTGPGTILQAGYKDPSSPADGDFSVVYHINPPSMVYAVSVDAIDAVGKTIENKGRLMELFAPFSKFGAPLSSAESLRVRYRPHHTRLLLKLAALPGVAKENEGAKDLFDVKAPQITIMDAYQMRRMISSITQLKEIPVPSPYSTSSAFPMRLTNVTPREIARRYLALDSARVIKVDSSAMTIEFEAPSQRSQFRKIVNWVKRFF